MPDKSQRGCHHEAQLRICMEEPSVQQLLQVADDADVDQAANIIGCALAQLLPRQPPRRQHAAGSVLKECGRHHHLQARAFESKAGLDDSMLFQPTSPGSLRRDVHKRSSEEAASRCQVGEAEEGMMFGHGLVHAWSFCNILMCSMIQSTLTTRC